MARGVEQMYQILDIANNEKYVVNKSHILSLKSDIDYDETIKKGSVLDLSIDEYYLLVNEIEKKDGNLLGYRNVIHFKEEETNFDPYAP